MGRAHRGHGWRLLALAVAGLLCAAGSRARAQADERSLEVERFRPTQDPNGFLTLGSTLPPGPGQWDAGLWVGYENQPLVVEEDGRDRPVLDHRLRGTVTGRFGLGDRVSLGLALPMVFFQSGGAEALADGGGELPVAALGDARLGLLVRALGAPARRSRDAPRGLGLAFEGVVSLPTGSDASLYGEPDARTELRAILDYHVFGLGGGLGLTWRHRFVERSLPLFGLEIRDELEAALALRVPLPPPKAPALLLEGRLTVDARAPFAEAALTAGEVDLGARFRAAEGAVALTLGVGVGVSDAIGVPRVRGFVAVHYGARVPDADEDGIPDAQDACRLLPEDLDGFEDEDGCLDPDDDLDGVEDAVDRCPREPVGFDDDADGDGCPDG